MRSRYLMFGLTLLALLLVGAGFVYTKMTACTKLACISFRDKDGFQTQTTYEDTAKAYRALLTRGDVTVRVEKYMDVTAQQAASNNDYKSMQIESLYEDAKSPYPGMLSDRIRCEGKFKPVFEERKLNGLTYLEYSGFLNSRMQYGTCIQDELTYASRAMMFYCPKERAWYQFEFITSLARPQPDLSGLLNSVRCTP